MKSRFNMPSASTGKSTRQIPRLRFVGFDRNWSSKKILEIGDTYNGLSGKSADDFAAGDAFITYKQIFDNSEIDTKKFGQVRVHPNEKQNKAQYGDIFFTTSSETPDEVGFSSVLLAKNSNPYLNSFSFGLRPNSLKEFDPVFAKYLFRTSNYRRKVIKLAQGSTRYNISKTTFKKIQLYIPEFNEQQKIANFFQAVDKWIDNLRTQKEAWEQYKKGMMQRIFSQEVRFKDENGKEFPRWEEKKLADVFNRITETNKGNNLNVLTISAQQGLVNQQRYFSKSVSAGDVTGYYLLRKGEFAYNKSYSKGYPMGAIKQLVTHEKGVVTTLYICFRAKKDSHANFFRYYFDAGLLNREISKIAQEGARVHGLLNISVTDFFKHIRLQVPCLEEQKKIVSYFETLDKMMKEKNQKVTEAEHWKKGLMQQMFV